MSRWQILFNITTLRLISFNLDYFWSFRNGTTLEVRISIVPRRSHFRRKTRIFLLCLNGIELSIAVKKRITISQIIWLMSCTHLSISQAQLLHSITIFLKSVNSWINLMVVTISHHNHFSSKDITIWNSIRFLNVDDGNHSTLYLCCRHLEGSRLGRINSVPIKHDKLLQSPDNMAEGLSMKISINQSF